MNQPCAYIWSRHLSGYEAVLGCHGDVTIWPCLLRVAVLLPRCCCGLWVLQGSRRGSSVLPLPVKCVRHNASHLGRCSVSRPTFSNCSQRIFRFQFFPGDSSMTTIFVDSLTVKPENSWWLLRGSRLFEESGGSCASPDHTSHEANRLTMV